MKREFILTVFLFINTAVFSGLPLGEDHKKTILWQELICRQEYDSAATVSGSFSKPLLKRFYLTCTRYSKALDFFDYGSFPEIIHTFDSLEEVFIDSRLPEATSNFYAGTSASSSAVLEAKLGNSLKAALKGRRAAAYFKDLRGIYPDSPDALGNIASYEYWLAKMLSWLPFASDKTRESIRDIEYAITKTDYYHFAFRISLLWIYYNEKKYEHALSISRELLDEYPSNRTAEMAAADCLFRLERYGPAGELYQDLLTEYSKMDIPGKFREIQMLNKLGIIAAAKKDITGFSAIRKRFMGMDEEFFEFHSASRIREEFSGTTEWFARRKR
ncbi:MAG: tetratricopeptide repeat protein [Fibrobacterota bacterium]